MNVLISLVVVLLLVVLGFAGARANLQYFLGVVLPYAAIVLFLAGVVWRVVRWARAPVPFHIPTTCGQQQSLPWIKQSKLESPSDGPWVVLRMALEVLLFRSLFRNTRTDVDRSGARLVFGSTKWLWGAGLLFHYSFLVIFVRHFRFFVEPTPVWISWIQNLDGFFQIGLPILYATDLLLVAAATYLFLRRVVIPQVKYISLVADYFPLFLILGIALSGILMRYFFKVDVVGVKQLGLGLMRGAPVVPDGVGAIFYVHLMLVCTLMIYFPWSKLMHMGGVFFSPTRNLANNSRMRRHENPWNPEVKTHPYEEYEDEFREKMVAAGLPVDKPLEQKKES
jgi:nitrate reductase gamma subunit